MTDTNEQPSVEKDVPHLTALLSAHHLEVEPRAYPSYACSCESWDGAEGDDGGESDGLRDNETGWATHVAERLVAAGYTRVIPPAEKHVPTEVLVRAAYALLLAAETTHEAPVDAVRWHKEREAFMLAVQRQILGEAGP